MARCGFTDTATATLADASEGVRADASEGVRCREVFFIGPSCASDCVMALSLMSNGSHCALGGGLVAKSWTLGECPAFVVRVGAAE